MRAARSVRRIAAVLGVVVSMATASIATTSTAAASTATPSTATASTAAAPRVIYYDAGRAGEFRDEVDAAAAMWSRALVNVDLLPGSPASIRVLVDDGWPRAAVTGLGRGTMYMGYQAVDQGYHVPRIAAHELGHLLGLPDRRTGRCADLMSGSSAPVSCTNARPSPAELAEVDALFGGRSTAAPFTGTSDERPVLTG